MKVTKIACVAATLASIFGSFNAHAQSWQTRAFSLALRSGESAEVMDLYWVINCKTLLTSLPEVAIMDGPPGVTATVTEAKVLPRMQGCSRPVEGGKLTLKADKVEDQSNTTMKVQHKGRAA